MTTIIWRSGHLNVLPLDLISLALDLEIKYMEIACDSEYQMNGINMIEMADTY